MSPVNTLFKKICGLHVSGDRYLTNNESRGLFGLPPTCQNAGMARKKPQPDQSEPMPPATSRAGSRHKARKMVALDPLVYQQLTLLASKSDRSTRGQLRHLVVNALAEAGLWPPPGPVDAPEGK